MAELPTHCTQIDITSTTEPAVAAPSSPPSGNQAAMLAVLQEMLAVQKRSCDILGEVLKHVSLQQRQRVAELKAWREKHPGVARACRRAAEGLSQVHTEFLTSLAEEAAESAEDFVDSDYALGEFIDRYGPRLAHFNGVMQLLSQLAMPDDPPSPSA